jgi:hypothetical protein
MMTPNLQGIMKRDVPFEEWHGKRAWVEACPQCGAPAERLREMPREQWGDGLGPHDRIDRIIQLLGTCHHAWSAVVYTDERRAIFYLV